MSMEPFMDNHAEELLRLLHLYVNDPDTLAGGVEDIRISELAEDLAMSMDSTSDAADRYRREIEETLTFASSGVKPDWLYKQ